MSMIRCVIGLLALAAAACSSSPAPTPAVDTAATPHPLVARLEEMRGVVRDLEVAVENDDRRAVSRLVQYPMPYTAADGKRVHVNTESEFVSQFETIFSPRIVAALLCQDLETLDYSPTFGTTVGEDEVGLDILFDKEGHSRVRILYVNNSPWPTGRPRKQDDACFHAQIQRSPRK